jgi:hypothetical protein
VGASKSSSPTRPKPSQQVGSTLHVHAQQWEYGAGGSEDAGRGMEPRKGYSRGQADIPQGGSEGKADGFQGPAGSSPGRARASAQDPTGVEERGMHAEGERGNLGEPPASLAHLRTVGPGAQRPWRGRGASTRPRARWGHHEHSAADTVLGCERPAKYSEMGRQAVLADQSTKAGGEARPKRPPGGKGLQGEVF